MTPPVPGEKDEANAADFSHENFVRWFAPGTVDLHPAPVLEPVDLIKTRTADDAQGPIRQFFVSFLPRAACPLSKFPTSAVRRIDSAKKCAKKETSVEREIDVVGAATFAFMLLPPVDQRCTSLSPQS